MAPPARLWTRRKDEDRARYCPHFVGVRHGKTIGSPISVILQNKDWKNWTEALPVKAGDPEKYKKVASPRPGHADLAGALKYNFAEARYVSQMGVRARIGCARRNRGVGQVISVGLESGCLAM